MAKKKAVSAGNATEPTPEAFSPPLANECPTKANVRAKLQDILAAGGHTHYDAAIKQQSLLAALLERYDPPLSTFCSGMVAGHLEAILDADPNVQLTARGRVYYRSRISIAEETALRTREVCPSNDDVREKMIHVLVQGEHTTDQNPMSRSDLRNRVHGLYDPPLSLLCEGLVQNHITQLIRHDPEFVETGLDGVYYQPEQKV